MCLLTVAVRDNEIEDAPVAARVQGREWLLSKVLDGHGYYEVSTASTGYVYPAGGSAKRQEKMILILSSHTRRSDCTVPPFHKFDILTVQHSGLFI